MWPRYSAAAATDTPPDSNLEANVWRVSWTLTVSNPARCRT